MGLYLKNIDNIAHGGETFRKAVHKVLNRQDDPMYSRRILATANSEQATVFGVSMNLSSIQTMLIQLTGRFVEYYASDLLYELTDLDAFERINGITKDDEWVIPIGLRKSGVDHEAYILNRLKGTVTSPMTQYVHEEFVYRKLLAIHIVDKVSDDGYGGSRTVRLLDISGVITTIDEADKPKTPETSCENKQIAGEMVKTLFRHADV